MFVFGFIVGGLSLGATVWFGKDKMTSFYKTTEDQIGVLNDKIQKLKAKL